jgi:hypothetical protein
MTMLFSLLLSAAFLVGVNVAWRKRYGGLAAFIFLVAGPTCGLPFVALPALVLSGLLTAVATLICWLTGAGQRCFLLSSASACILAHAIVGFFTVGVIGDRQALRSEYPTVSVVDRLAYEGTRRDSLSGHDSTPKAFNVGRVQWQESLLDLDKNYLRDSELERLHQGIVQDFIDSPGFGITRGTEASMFRAVRLPDPGPIRLPEVGEIAPDTIKEPAQASQIDFPRRLSLDWLHDRSVVDFVNPRGFGLIRARNEVVGFQSHRFHEMPDLPKEDPGFENWWITRLELVSILKHDPPRVYLSKFLPRMDDLDDHATRPLNTFERDGLIDLQHGQDLKLDQSSLRIRMLGSIRAMTKCTECHQTNRGDLLGAFSYEMRPQRMGTGR